MSLVLLSNESGQESGRKYSDWQQPYSFTNHLSNTITLDTDSEVACVSVKCNKDPLVTLGPHQRWFQMFGTDCATNDISSDDTVCAPIECYPLLTDATKEEHVNLTDISGRITTGMSRGMPHPDIYGLPKCSLKFNGGEWDGFNLEYDVRSSAGTKDYVQPANGWSKYRPQANVEALEWDVATRKLTADEDAYFDTIFNNTMVAEQHPMSLHGGELRINLEGCVDPATGATGDKSYKINSSGSRMAFGLTRAYKWNADYTSGGHPEYFSPSDGSMDDDAGNQQFFDYVLRVQQAGPGLPNYLTIGCATRGLKDGEISMQEIEYWGWDNLGSGVESPFTARYSMSTNADKMNQFKISCENETVTFWSHVGDIDDSMAVGNTGNGGTKGTWTILCSFKQDSYANWAARPNKTDIKKNFPKPLGQACWNLYPKVYIEKADFFLNVTKCGVRTDNAQTFMDPNGDWWARCMLEYRQDDAKRIELRYMFDATNTTGGPNKNGLLAYQDIDVVSPSAIPFGNYTYAFIPSPSSAYVGTKGANMGLFLGFLKSPYVGADGTASATKITYRSDMDADAISDASLFVRLNNFTQRSFNAAVGRPSKILYTLPRFDSAGKDTGNGLFYEPSSLIYLKLGNTAPLTVNEFNISICNHNEVLSKTLTGQTIIVLHFRKSPK